jgi:single-stranded-DNA-specific exonuclease
MSLTKTNYKIIADCKGMYEQEIVDIILENRGIKDVEHFLNPEECDLLSLDSLMRIDDARQIIEEGIDNNKSFGIFFDTDTDGVSSGTIMTRYLKHYTDRVSSYINVGKAHGLIGQDLGQFEGVDILIVVDSLDKDTSQYEELHNKGVQIIVLDHHTIDSNVDYDKYVTLVSSQRDYDNPSLSGAGVVWKFCKYLDEYFMNDYADEYVDLAACGILADVCDVSEDSKENRYIVNEGLKNLKNPAMKKILGSYEFNSKAILFSVAPLINACCRIGRNKTVMKLFLSDENKEVLALKKQLEECKEIQASELERILPSVYEDFDSQNGEVLYTFIDTEYGIGGVIGNKCLDIYNKPMFILKDCGDKYCGSMRSVGYGDFMTLCNNTDLAMLHGHEQASGIEIEKDKFEEFVSVVNEQLSKMEQTTSDEIEVDCEINIEDMTRTLVDKIKEINKISGAGFKPITFKVVNINEYGIGSFKQGKHLVITPTDYIQLIEWNTKADYEALEDNALMNDPIEVIGELDSGFFARKFMLKVIISDLKVGVA